MGEIELQTGSRLAIAQHRLAVCSISELDRAGRLAEQSAEQDAQQSPRGLEPTAVPFPTEPVGPRPLIIRQEGPQCLDLGDRPIELGLPDLEGWEDMRVGWAGDHGGFRGFPCGGRCHPAILGGTSRPVQIKAQGGA